MSEKLETEYLDTSQVDVVYMGKEIDNCKRELDVYYYKKRIYLIYNKGTTEEYTTSELIENIKVDPDKYLYTPYAGYAGYTTYKHK